MITTFKNEEMSKYIKFNGNVFCTETIFTN